MIAGRLIEVALPLPGINLAALLEHGVIERVG